MKYAIVDGIRITGVILFEHTSSTETIFSIVFDNDSLIVDNVRQFLSQNHFLGCHPSKYKEHYLAQDPTNPKHWRWKIEYNYPRAPRRTPDSGEMQDVPPANSAS